MMSEGAMADWSALFYKSTLTNKTSSPTMGYTAFAFAMSVVRFTGDWFINKVGTFKTLIISGLLMSLGLLIALGFAVSYAVIIGFGLVGAGVACVVPIVYSTAGKSKTMSAGMAIAAVSTIGYTGFLVGPPIIGFIAEATSLRFSLGIVILLGLLIVLLTKKVQA
jgi:MFS family permease